MGGADGTPGGRCECGGARYRLAGEALACYACHCTDCQRASGSAFSLSLLVRRADLWVLAGDVTPREFVRNGNAVVRHQCAHCGTALWYAAPASAEVVALKPGTLDAPEACEPVAHVWTRSARRGLPPDDGRPRFPTQPDLETLLDLWAGRGPSG